MDTTAPAPGTGTTPAPDTTALLHTITDLDTARTAALRMADTYARLLTDGLHALRNGSPHVAEEFMERTVDALERSRDALRAAAYRSDAP